MNGKIIVTLLFIMLVPHFSSFAYDFEVDGIYFKITSKENREVCVTYKYQPTIYTSGTGYENRQEIILPEKVKHDGVEFYLTAIGDETFYNCGNLKNVTLPPTITNIGSNAFSFCRNLSCIKIPDSVTKIGNEAFWACSSLSSINIPNSVTAIGRGAFAYCKNLGEMCLPNSLGYFDSSWIENCDNLDNIIMDESHPYLSMINGNIYSNDKVRLYCWREKIAKVQLPNTIVFIYNNAFSYNKDLVSITIPNSVMSIGNYAFSNCSSLESITIPNSVSSIGSHIFQSCHSLNSVKLPSMLYSIPDYAFDHCSNLEYIELPKTIVSIGQYSFYGCNRIESLDLPEMVNYIGPYSFSNCSNLASVIIPATVTEISDYVFWDSPSIRTIVCRASTPPEIRFNTFSYTFYPSNIFEECTLYVPKGCKEVYASAQGWYKFLNISEMSSAQYQDALVDGAVSVAVRDGGIVVEGAKDALVEVYGLNGGVVYRGYGAAIDGLPKGVYVVRVGELTRKVIL